MDFYEHQDRARSRTGLLIFLFGLGVVLLASALTAVIVALFPFGYVEEGTYFRRQVGRPTIQEFLQHADWPSVGMLVLGILGIILLVSGFKSLTLAAGGGARIAESLGGRLLQGSTTDSHERRLRNVVEEMALASGTPVPDIYIMDGQEGINAFAAGLTPEKAVIGVTEGCVRQLSRDELQGVIAHEFSHITHGDMRINLRLMGVLFGILFLQQIGYWLMWTRSRKQNQVALIAIALYILGAIGYFMASLIKAAVSRQREFLADASAVQFTRNPNGIAGALRKIGDLGSKVDSPRSSEVSHMFFANGVSSLASELFATHPPLAERVGRIEGQPMQSRLPAGVPGTPAAGLASGFAGAAASGQPASSQPASGQPASGQPASAAGSTAAFSPTPDTAAREATTATSRGARSSHDLIAQAGTPTAQGLSLATAFLQELPETVATAVHEPFGARAAVYCLLSGNTVDEQMAALQWLRGHADPAVLQETERLLQPINQLGARARLPIIDLSIPALRQLSATQMAQFSACTHGLVMRDKKVDLEEYVLVEVLRRQLDGRAEPGTKQSLPSTAQACALLLSAMADQGQTSARESQTAYAAGASHLGLPGALGQPVPWDVNRLDRALSKLGRAKFVFRKQVLQACAAVAAHDGKLALDEAELLRAVAEALGCPLPAFA